MNVDLCIRKLKEKSKAASTFIHLDPICSVTLWHKPIPFRFETELKKIKLYVYTTKHPCMFFHILIPVIKALNTKTITQQNKLECAKAITDVYY